MKKVIASIILSLSALLCLAQNIEFNGVARMEAESNPSENGLTLGSSAIYTFLDGSFAPGWNFSISNHWLSKMPDDLYSNLFRAQSPDFIDWAYVSYSLGDFTLSAGKDILPIGLMEFNPNDVDSYWQLNSDFWNEFNTYQWGVKALWQINDDHSIALNFSNSPLETGKYFEHGLFAWNLAWQGCISDIKTKWTINRFGKLGEDGAKSADWYLLLGNSYDFNGIEFTGDIAIRNFRSFIPSISAKAPVASFLDLSGKAGLYGGEGFYVGAVAEARPFEDFQEICFFLCSTYQGYYEKGFSGCLGVKYNLTKSWSR